MIESSGVGELSRGHEAVCRRRTVLPLVLIGLLGPFGAARSGEHRLQLDPERTEITFELGAAMHTVRGTAALLEGWIEFPTEGGSVSGRMVVSAPSMSTAHEGRDRKMHAKVLESERFADIVFRPETVRGAVALEGESHVLVDGLFEIHGGEHPLTIEAVTRVEGSELEATIEFEVPYVAWGLKNPSKLLLKVSKVVLVRVHGFGRLEPSGRGS
jgi:polyisoprenoid-binding protein YceI